MGHHLVALMHPMWCRISFIHRITSYICDWLMVPISQHLKYTLRDHLRDHHLEKLAWRVLGSSPHPVFGAFLQNCQNYPMVMTNIAMEHGYKNSRFSQKEMMLFHSYVSHYHRVYPSQNPMKNHQFPMASLWFTRGYVWCMMVHV